MARIDGTIVGFGDLDSLTGYLDRLYVHRDFQRRGIAAALTAALETAAWRAGNPAVTAEASITALPFFMGRGYRVIREQQKTLHGQVFCNYLMEKGPMGRTMD